jgi:DNA (cytosine-5)-methyltransferase 1
MTLTFGSLFAGIGGFDLGFERAGMECAWQVEIDPDAQRVLRRHWPDAKLLPDVTKAGRKNLPKVDVICGGFPCQDLSVAGKRAGIKGKRSGLFYHMARITRELKPAVLVWENVPGLLSSERGRCFLEVLAEMDRIGLDG